METALQSFLLSVPQAAAIWLVILAVALLAVATLTLPERLRAIDPASWGRLAGLLWPAKDAGSPVDDRDWTHRYADEVTVAADRAAVTAQRRRVEWERAQDGVDEAWAAFDAADRAVRRCAAATAFPVAADDGCPPDEFADRERYLHRSATAACRRREISMHELNDVLAHRNGWDPRRHPVAQELFLRRAVRDRCLVIYREATERERQAWRTAEVSAAALRSLREEACAATLRAGEHERTPGELWWAEQWAPETADAAPAESPAEESPAVTVVIPRLVTH